MPDLGDMKETPEEHKLRAMRVTAAARFNAAHRLRRHERASLFSISFCSLAVVIISMLEPFGVTLSVPEGAVNLSLAGVSLIILVVSLLVSGRKYGERAEQMHQGAVEINAISRRLDTAIAKSDQNAIEQLSEDYEAVLKVHENHEHLDYRVARIRRYPTFYEIDLKEKIACWVMSQLDVAPHLVPFLAVVAFFVYLLNEACIDCTP